MILIIAILFISATGERRKLRLGGLTRLARGVARLGSKPRDGSPHSFYTLEPFRLGGLQMPDFTILRGMVASSVGSPSSADEA